MEVRQVNSENEFTDFINIPFKIYRGNPNWVPPLISEVKKMFSNENPFWQHAERALFVAYNASGPCGRVAAIVNHNHNKFHNEKCGFLGFFECVDDSSVARKLFEESLSWLYSKGMTVVRAPVSPSTNDECGLLIEGFDSPPKIMMPYNPPYYVDFFQEAGFKKAKDLLAFIMSVEKGPLERLSALGERILKRNPKISVRKINRKKFDEEVDIILNIYNKAWEKNWGFVPMTDAEIRHLAKDLKKVIDPEILWIAFYEEDPAGFLMALPDINEVLIKIKGRLTPGALIKILWYSRKIKSLRLLTLGIKKEYQRLGLDILLYGKSLEAALKKGYKECEFSWILEDNLLTIRAANFMAGREYKRYRIFQK